ncbi:MAG: 30S ribosomal protein S16 [Verrucomicrobiae bacterium]|nr:30S ribosomal protein S16 [Verrucomicrobiae bacterium]
MATVIRLRREGTKNRPYYRVVAADKRSPRDGKFLELLGTYNPIQKQDNAKLNLERIEFWIAKGAKPTDTVQSLIKKTKKAAA